MSTQRYVQAMRMKQRAMAEDVRSITLINESGRYDTLTQEYITDEIDTIVVNALLGRYHENEVNGVLIQENDIRFEIISVDLKDFKLEPNTTVDYEGRKWNVVRSRKVLMGVNTHIQLRST